MPAKMSHLLLICQFGHLKNHLEFFQHFLNQGSTLIGNSKSPVNRNISGSLPQK